MSMSMRVRWTLEAAAVVGVVAALAVGGGFLFPRLKERMEASESPSSPPAAAELVGGQAGTILLPPTSCGNWAFRR